MNTTLSLQIDRKVLSMLTTHLGLHGDTAELSEAVTAAIAFWLAEPGGAHPNGMRGYQWKSLFLPEGTLLQSWSYGEHNYARVEGDQIIHRGRPVSPNQFAHSFARTTRNAWRDLSVRRPGDKHFRMALLLRRELAAQTEATTLPAPPDPAAPASPATQGDSVSQLLAALLAHIAAAFRPVAVAPPVVAPPAKGRDVTPGPEWNLPERRKFRFRLEDVAFT
jgi:hypothetical protein